MSDVAGSSGRDRQVEGRITARDPRRTRRAQACRCPAATCSTPEVALDWRAPQANGAPIDYYEVRDQQGGATQRCGSTSCDITGLDNGTTYSVQRARAQRRRLLRLERPPRQPRRPTSPSDLVGPIELDRRRRRLPADRLEADRDQGRRRACATACVAGRQLPATDAEATIIGLDNHLTLRRSRCVPENALDPRRRPDRPTFQPIGTPGTPAPPTVTDQETAGLDRRGVADLGRPSTPTARTPVRYTVFRNGTAAAAAAPTSRPACDNAGLAYDGTRLQLRRQGHQQAAASASSALGPGHPVAGRRASRRRGVSGT